MGCSPRIQAASLALAASLFAACTDSYLEPKVITPTNLDDRLTLRGTVCAPKLDDSGFPVKVVVLVDQSGSMCISDPPGSQEQPGLCEQLTASGVIPPGITQPARVRALKALIAQFEPQKNVQLAVIPFETNVSKDVWPATVNGAARFEHPTAAKTNDFVARLQSELGKGTDYQGALAYAYALISGDIAAVDKASPAVLPRTRYVVVFLTDGTPYPRCAANDDLTGCGPGALDCYGEPDHPERIWADSASAGDFCNLTDPLSKDNITGFTVGTDRNQNYQIFGFVDRLMDLKQQYNIGDIRFNTVLLLNQAAVEACGPICQDIYGVYPTVAQAQYPAAAKAIARWTLRRMAERGNGVYQEFVDSSIQSLGLGALDYTSLGKPNVLKTLLVQGLSSVPGGDARKVDSDGDGLPDELDDPRISGTSPFAADSDQDGFDDRFEVRRKEQGFIAANDLDVRGCNPKSPLTLGCIYNDDSDGDGLSSYAESFVKSRPDLVDSDGDGIPDGLEVRYGLDPLVPNVAGLDTDGDGIPDRDEFLADTDPTRPDRTLYDRDGYQYEIQQRPSRVGDPICYDFTVSNLKLLTPPSRGGVQGYNLFKLWFASAPSSGVATDYGEWKVACAWAQYDPPGVRIPAGAELDQKFQDGNFLLPPQLSKPADYLGTKCLGRPPK